MRPESAKIFPRQARWVALTGLVAIVIFLAAIWEFSKRDRARATSEAFTLSRQVALLHGQELTSPLVDAMGNARGLAATLEGLLKDSPPPNRDQTDRIFTNIVKKNPFCFGAWAIFEPGRYDGRDAEYAGKPGYAADGSYSPFAYRKNGGIVFQHSPYDSAKNMTYYTLPRSTRRECVIDPYADDTAGGILMSSLCAPIMMGNDVIGVAGIDISLANLCEAVRRIHLPHKGFAMLVGANGLIAAHPTCDFAGRNIADFGVSSHVIEAVKRGTEAAEVRISPTSNDEMLFLYQPIRIGSADKIWSVAVGVPTSAIMENARGTTLTAIQIGLTAFGLFAFLLLQIYSSLVNPLREAERRIRRVFNHVHAGVAVFTPDGQLVDVNDQLLEIFGLRRSDLARFSSITEFIEAGASLLTNVPTEHPLDIRCRRPLQKSYFPAEIQFSHTFMFGQDAYVATIRDISRRSKAEEESRRLVSLIEQSFEIIALASVDSRLLYLNPYGRQLMGISPSTDIRQIGLLDRLAVSPAAGNPDVIMKNLLSEGRFQGEGLLKNLPGTDAIPVEFHIFIADFPRLDEDSVIAAVLHDLTARKNAEQALNAARSQELSIGGQIQGILLAGQPVRTLPGIQMEIKSIPSTHVDGDFIEVSSGPEHCDLLIADVMGKGVPAALLGAATKTQFLRAAARIQMSGQGHPGPAKLMNEVHELLTPQLIRLDRFITITHGEFDLKNYIFRYVNAGHTDGIHYHAATGNIRLLRSDNVPMGFLADEVYEEYEASFGKGDVFVFYSDGVTEAPDTAGDMFGIDRLVQLVERHASEYPRALAGRIVDAVSTHVGNEQLPDDLTCVVIRIDDEPGVKEDSAAITLSSTLDELTRAREFIKEFVGRRNPPPLDENALEEFVLAADEAIANIVKHAYRGDPDGTIDVTLDLHSEMLRLIIFHRGLQLESSKVQPPSFDGSRSSGFGLYIIDQLMDEVRYIEHADICEIRLGRRRTDVLRTQG